MNRIGIGLVVAVCLVSWQSAAWANKAPPFDLPPQAEGLPLVVRIDPNARISRLLLPPEAAGAEAAPAAPQPQEGGLLPSASRTVVAGLCLSLAAVGLFFLTRVQGAARLVVWGVVGGLAAAGGAVAWANLPPFRQPDPPPQMGARVVVEWNGRRGSPVTLIIAAGAIQLGPELRPAPPPGAAPGGDAPNVPPALPPAPR